MGVTFRILKSLINIFDFILIYGIYMGALIRSHFLLISTVWKIYGLEGLH